MYISLSARLRNTSPISSITSISLYFCHFVIAIEEKTWVLTSNQQNGYLKIGTGKGSRQVTVEFFGVHVRGQIKYS